MPGGLYACQYENFGGACFYNRPEQVRGCSLLLIGNPNGSVAHKPQSLGPDEGGYCDVFKGRVCNDQTRVKRIDYPGARKLIDIPDWDAIQCYNHLNKVSLRNETAAELRVDSEGALKTEYPYKDVQLNDGTVPSKEDGDVIGSDPAAAINQRSQPGGITYYEEENFGGAKFWMAPSRCHKYQFVIEYPDKPQEYLTPRSLKPDEGTFCRMFKGSCLEEDMIYFVYPEGLSKTPDFDYMHCCPADQTQLCWQ